MWFSTVFRVLNDGADNIPRNKEEFADKIMSAINDGQGDNSIGLWNHANLIASSRAIDASDTAVFIVKHNSLTEVSDIKKLEGLREENREQLISDLEYTVKFLRKKFPKSKK